MDTEKNHGESDEARIMELRSVLEKAAVGISPIESYTMKKKFVDELRKTHTNIGNYKLYHLLIGSSSTSEMEREMEFDLPNGEMEAFIRSL